MLTERLVRAFVKTPDNVKDTVVRTAYGKLAGAAGIVSNALLFFFKLLAGLLSGSVAVMADAFNNLSDAGSSVVTLLGFRLSGAPADEKHPFGHGRVEYLSALSVAALIMLAGVELASSAFEKILRPEKAEFSWLTTIILIASILIKLWMAHFNRQIGKRIHSQALFAAATDSRNDVICTGVVLVSSLFTALTDIPIDGYVGMAVAVFVVWAGFSVMRETISPLLGEAPPPELVEDIRRIVLSQDGVVGIHDLIVHNYGPGRCLVSLHAEVPAHKDILHSHEVIDSIEVLLLQELNVLSCIHMDPVDTENEQVTVLKELTETVLGDINSELSLHDFRVVFGEERTNVIFDVVVPFNYSHTDDLKKEIQRRLQMVDS
ncbi:MAG: cation transporter, partial [Clostridia bacterium]|nr:cation transporter [Clostridia bacterium]